jgi:hypothetical protein
MHGHIVSRASEKNSTAWRVIAEVVAYVVEVIWNSGFLKTQMQTALRKKLARSGRLLQTQ